MIKVGIIGATGYTGAELVRLLCRHPQAEIKVLTSQSFAGQSFSEVYPHLTGLVDLTLSEQDEARIVDQCDVIFTALPHGLSMGTVKKVFEAGKVAIDLGADFRLNDYKVYQQWYQAEHQAVQLLDQAVYGLPEIHRKDIAKANIIANPGCYPTSCILGLTPVLKNKIADVKTIIIDSKSGVSGAGRSATATNHFVHVNDNFKAYKVGAHRHIPEIEQELSKAAGGEVAVTFTPHLAPMTRGILSTIYVSLKEKLSTGDVLEICRRYYRDERFVKVLPEGVLPETKNVYGSNYCHLGAVVDRRTNRAIIIAAIDNLVKGASGQAIQNMNIRFGLEESLAIDIPGMYP